MLYLVGLGLADETDITVRGLEVVKRAERVYLEAYTSILLVDKAKLVRSPAPDTICLLSGFC
jgi:diphthine synthase